jgi:hypothetical protein
MPEKDLRASEKPVGKKLPLPLGTPKGGYTGNRSLLMSQDGVVVSLDSYDVRDELPAREEKAKDAIAAGSIDSGSKYEF